MSAHPGPFAVDTWLERTVRLPDGRMHLMLVDAAQTDGVTEMYLKGDGIWVNSYLVAVMFALTSPGDRVLDLGGFVGEFALAAAAHGCDITTVEASAEQARLLATSAELNHFDGLRVVQAAVGDRTGTVRFDPRGPYGQVARGPGEPGDEQITQLTVDNLVDALGWQDVAFVKIDVEGSEAAVLQGASRLLSRPDAPAILIESNTFVLRDTSPDPAALLRQVEKFGYSLHRVAPGAIYDWDSSMFQPTVVCDYLALKGRSPADVGLEVRPPLSLNETAAAVAAEVRLDSFDHRIAMAWQLKFAPLDLLAHPKVAAALASLQRDPDERIRSAMAWMVGEQPRPATTWSDAADLQDELDGAWAAERALRLGAEARLAVAAELRGWHAAAPAPVAPTNLAPVPTSAMVLAARITDFAGRHRILAAIGRRLVRLMS